MEDIHQNQDKQDPNDIIMKLFSPDETAIKSQVHSQRSNALTVCTMNQWCCKPLEEILTRCIVHFCKMSDLPKDKSAINVCFIKNIFYDTNLFKSYIICYYLG